ncbi:MAG: type IV secretion system protein, partial [Nocardioidaceae bacterium]
MTPLAFTAMQLPASSASLSDSGCQWWNFACQGGSEVVDAGLSAITRSTASGAALVLGQIVKIIDGSTQVPLADAGYRQIYYGFLGLAAPLIGVIRFLALVVATVRRDPATLGRAVVGVGVAGLGGAFYIAFAQLLVGLDNWLSHGIVQVTGQNLSQAITRMTGGFENVAGTQGDAAANMLIIILMMIMLLAGLILWFVLVLRKIAILVVVAFAPLLIAGYLWSPTRAWVRRATEVLVALVFTKSAIFGLFGIGLALISRGSGQSLSDFV